MLEKGRRSDNQTNQQHSSDVGTYTSISNCALLGSVSYPDKISFLTKIPSMAQFAAGMGRCHTALNKSLVRPLSEVKCINVI